MTNYESSLGGVTAAMALVVASLLFQRRWSQRKQEEKLEKLRRMGKEKRITVGIIGGGLGSLAMVKKCRDLGLDFHIYEKLDQFGGVWVQNSCKRGWLVDYFGE